MTRTLGYNYNHNPFFERIKGPEPQVVCASDGSRAKAFTVHTYHEMDIASVLTKPEVTNSLNFAPRCSAWSAGHVLLFLEPQWILKAKIRTSFQVFLFKKYWSGVPYSLLSLTPEENVRKGQSFRNKSIHYIPSTSAPVGHPPRMMPRLSLPNCKCLRYSMLDPSASPRNHFNINNFRNWSGFPPPSQYRKQQVRKILIK